VLAGLPVEALSTGLRDAVVPGRTDDYVALLVRRCFPSGPRSGKQ
jgi:hypothetical protein